MLEQVTPSRRLDAAIHTRLFGPVLSLNSGYFIGKGLPVPSYSTSIDAAVGLCRTLLPGWIWRLATCYISDDVWLMPDLNNPTNGEVLKLQFPQCEQEGYSPLRNGPGLDVSTTPSDRPALGLIGCLLSVLDGIHEDRMPYDDMREIVALEQASGDLRAVDLHPFVKPLQPEETLSALDAALIKMTLGSLERKKA